MKVPPSNQVDDVIEGDDDDGLNDDAPHSPSRDGDFSGNNIYDMQFLIQPVTINFLTFCFRYQFFGRLEYLWLENEEEFDEQISN